MANREQLSLFQSDALQSAPLAHRMRPRTLEEYVGQGHLLGAGKLLARVLAAPRLPSLVLWGPPGTGKTTLARLIASQRDAEFVPFSAVTSGVPELRVILKEARDRKLRGGNTLLFVDEIHRFNKTQQDAFLQHLEDGTITLIGATTENPSFQLNAALLSRVRVLTLQALEEADLAKIVERALAEPKRGLGLEPEQLTDEALKVLIDRAAGDARSVLNTLEAASLAASTAGPGYVIQADDIRMAMEQVGQYDRAGEHHYDTISAFIKSIRGSSADASLFWLARMLNRGEDPVFIARRLVILASEDVGNADPQGLGVAVAALQAVQNIGLPEAIYPLTQATTYLALAPKSNAAKGYFRARDFEANHPGYQVPIHLRNAPTKLMKELGYGQAYLYPHDYPDGWVDQSYWPEGVTPQRFYEPVDRGFEAVLRERRRELIRKRQQNRRGPGGPAASREPGPPLAAPELPPAEPDERPIPAVPLAEAEAAPSEVSAAPSEPPASGAAAEAVSIEEPTNE